LCQIPPWCDHKFYAQIQQCVCWFLKNWAPFSSRVASATCAYISATKIIKSNIVIHTMWLGSMFGSSSLEKSSRIPKSSKELGISRNIIRIFEKHMHISVFFLFFFFSFNGLSAFRRSCSVFPFLSLLQEGWLHS